MIATGNAPAVLAERIQIQEGPWSTAFLCTLAAVALYFAASAARLYIRSVRGRGAGGPKSGRTLRKEATLYLVTAVACAGVPLILAAKERVVAVELGQGEATMHYRWSSEVIPYRQINSLHEGFDTARGTRRSGRRVTYVVRVVANGREHQVWARADDPEARGRVERVYHMIKTRMAGDGDASGGG